MGYVSLPKGIPKNPLRLFSFDDSTGPKAPRVDSVILRKCHG